MKLNEELRAKILLEIANDKNNAIFFRNSTDMLEAIDFYNQKKIETYDWTERKHGVVSLMIGFKLCYNNTPYMIYDYNSLGMVEERIESLITELTGEL